MNPIPEGHLIIARHFSGGSDCETICVPSVRLKWTREARQTFQPSRRDGSPVRTQTRR